jgi:prepilin-type N-terminal cleavage/methylation domain-containing protein
MRRKDIAAFTLIELLIVVAIIAILAAIAIPNMLEAQTRAKVARVKADLRTIAGAIEMYQVDVNRCPSYHYVVNSHSSVGFSFHIGGTVISLQNSPPFHGPNPVTSPIAYLTSFPKDPYGTRVPGEVDEAADYYFVNWDYAIEMIPGNPFFVALRQLQGTWRLHSPGPDRGGPDTYDMGGLQRVYDPTNGTVSVGDVIRTQKLGQL